MFGLSCENFLHMPCTSQNLVKKMFTLVRFCQRKNWKLCVFGIPLSKHFNAIAIPIHIKHCCFCICDCGDAIIVVTNQFAIRDYNCYRKLCLLFEGCEKPCSKSIPEAHFHSLACKSFYKFIKAMVNKASVKFEQLINV